MAAFFNIVVAVSALFFIFSGLFSSWIMAFGLNRNNNGFSVLHIASIGDMFGLPLTLVGLALLVGTYASWIISAKIFLLVLFIYLLSPIVGYLCAKMCVLEDDGI